MKEEYKALWILSITQGFTREEIEEAADQLDLKGREFGVIEHMVSEQIKHNRFMKSLKKGAIKLKLKGVRIMPIVAVFLIALTLW